MFVKFSCGCVGLVGVQGLAQDEHVILQHCDGESQQDIGFHTRVMQDPTRSGGWEAKSYEPLGVEETQALIRGVQMLLNDGERFRTIKQMLG